jgi:hypothetical protein
VGAILQHLSWDPAMLNNGFPKKKHANFLRTFPKTAKSKANREKYFIYFVKKPNVPEHKIWNDGNYKGVHKCCG